LLINPCHKQIIKSNFPDEIDREVKSLPPLGILYIAAFLKKQSRHQVDVIDLNTSNAEIKLEDIIPKNKPDMVGIYTSTFNLLDVFLTARKIKEINPGTHINLGGPHVNIYPQETMSNPNVDSIVAGEGEITFTELADAIGDKTDLSGVNGIFYRAEGKIIKTRSASLIEDLDILPFPERKALDLGSYYNKLSLYPVSTTMISSRGCSYNCTFCYHSYMGKNIRFRSCDNVVAEMQECFNLGIKDIFFIDDVFTLNRQRTFEICDKIVKKDLKINWSIRTRVDSVDALMLERLKAAGCSRIQFGVEAGTQTVLDALNKNITLGQVEEAFRMAKKAKIETLAYFMIGSPTETKEQVLETIDFAVRLNPDYVHFSITMPFPDTQLYRDGLKNNIFKSDFWREFASKPLPEAKLCYWEEFLPEDELCRLLKKAYRRFYFRPAYLIQALAKPSLPKEFKKKLRMGAKLFEYVCN